MPPMTNIQALMQQYPAIGILPRSFLLGSDFQQFAAELKGYLELIRWTWYSAKNYPAAGIAQLLFFQDNMSTAPNGVLDTNMAVPGQLSGGEAMIIRNIRILPIPAAADVYVPSGPAVAFPSWYNVLMYGWLELAVGDKLYVRGAPLTLFPSGQGLGNTVLQGTATIGTGIMQVQSGDPSNRALWEEDPPIYVPSTRTVNLSLNWKTVQTVVTGSAATATGNTTKIYCFLDGWRVRLVQ